MAEEQAGVTLHSRWNCFITLKDLHVNVQMYSEMTLVQQQSISLPPKKILKSYYPGPKELQVTILTHNYHLDRARRKTYWNEQINRMDEPLDSLQEMQEKNTDRNLLYRQPKNMDRNSWGIIMKYFEALEEYKGVSENTDSKLTNYPMCIKYAERFKRGKKCRGQRKGQKRTTEGLRKLLKVCKSAA